MLWSCDTPSTSFEGSIETIENISGSELEKKLSSLSAGKTGYTCSVSTWDMPGSEKQNTHVSVIHYFPEDLVEQADGETQTWTFVVTGPSQAEPRSFGEYDNVIQKATCNLPAAEGIEEEMIGRLLHMNPALTNSKLTSAENHGMWNIHVTLEESASTPSHEALDPDIANPMSAPCSSGVYCSEFFITVTTINGNVHSFVVDCDVWTFYVEYCDGGGGIPYDPPPGGGGGGSGPPGGDGSHVDDPCYIDPDGPAQLPHPFCPNPCEWMAPPVGWMCGDSCQINDSIIDDLNVQVAMHEAWKASYGPEMYPFLHSHRNEAMSMVTVTSSGYEVTEIPAGPNTSSCHFDGGNYDVPTNTVALIHTHPYSHGDILEDPRCPSGTYDANTVSAGDEALMQALINGGFNIPIYVIDKDKIRVIQPSNPSQYAQTVCNTPHLLDH